MNYDEMKTGESNKINTTHEPYKSEKKETPIITIDAYSQLYQKIAIVIAALGLVAGIVLGFALPMSVREYSFSNHATEIFNWPLMLGIWISFAVTAIGFWAIYCHLNNQEETLIELKRINSKLPNKDE